MTNRVQTALAVLAGIAIGAGLMIVGGVMAHRGEAPVAAATAAGPVAAPVPPARSGHELLDEVADRVRREYVDPVAPGTLEQAAVKGLVESLDPHSAFLDAREYGDMQASTTGSYTGVGLEVADQDGRIVVVAPIEGSPAERAGLRAGDILLEVSGQAVGPGQLEGAIERMRGLAGSRVEIVVSRQGEPEPLRFDLERSEVHVHTVQARVLPGSYGYVRITHFSDSTPGDFDGAVLGLQEGRGTPLRGLVLDLRDNPGGVLESAVGVADSLLESGVIVRAEGRTVESRFEMDATEGDLLGGAPIVVLVDRGSASGAEIVAGALRDHGRATLMGERTFGKGSVQTVMPLSNGEALKLTTSRYYTPSGRSIQERGLEPDVRLPSMTHSEPQSAEEPARDPAVRSALQYLRDRDLDKHVALAGAR